MRSSPFIPSRSPPHVFAMSVAAAYLLGAAIALAATREADGLAALWLPDAILLAALLLRPAERWRLIAWCGCAGLAATLWCGASPIESLWFVVADVSGMLAGAAIGRRLDTGTAAIDQPATVIRFGAIAAAAAAVGASVAALPTFAELGPGSRIWASWFAPELLGILVLTPLALMLARAWQPGRRRDAAAMAMPPIGSD